MNKTRIEAFSDGVLAIIITIMVLELRAPHGQTLESLTALIPTFLSYSLSFIYIGIYWSNHHHLLHAAKKINGKMMWANLHLLFWLSLIPFTTSWLGESHFAETPMAVYGVSLLLPAISYVILQFFILQDLGKDSPISKAIGQDWKGKVSPLFYICGIASAPYSPILSGFFYITVALLWLVPDKRIEKAIIAHTNT